MVKSPGSHQGVEIGHWGQKKLLVCILSYKFVLNGTNQQVFFTTMSHPYQGGLPEIVRYLYLGGDGSLR